MINVDQDSTMTGPPANQVLVIDKAVRLLDRFRDADTLTLGELSESLRMSKSTVHRLLSSLEQVGFIERGPQAGSYRLGMKLFELGSLVQNRMHLRQVALHYMTELVERTGETSFLFILDGSHALCIERVEGKHVQSLAIKVGGHLPLNAGGASRVLLAFAPEQVREAYLANGPFPRFTAHTITAPNELRADLEEIREEGYALSYEDVTIGVAALGVPLFDYRGEVIGGLSLSGITPRWTSSHIADMLVELKAMGERISERMGWRRDMNDFANTFAADEEYGISGPERRKPENELPAGEKAAVADARRGEA
jgi:DNA-binding IclR family transcriptional regulator